MKKTKFKLPQKIKETISLIKKNKIKVPPRIQRAMTLIEVIKEHEENLNKDKTIN